MSLIQEANTDDTFNRHMMKIQDAIEALEQLPFSKDSRPVGSQITALKASSEDLSRLAKKLSDLRTSK